MTCPPEEATDSTAPAIRGGIPYLFMSGIVKEPVPATLAAPLPENMPNIMLEMTAIWGIP
jgi:hypothetical protein